MSTFGVTRSIDIHYAHRVPGHLGKCAGLHGHRGTIIVTVVGQLQQSGPGAGMVLDFQVVEDALLELKQKFCHRTLLWERDSLLTALRTQSTKLLLTEGSFVSQLDTDWGTIVSLDCIPTAENLAHLCFLMLSKKLNNGGVCRVKQVSFQETAHSVATYPIG